MKDYLQDIVQHTHSLGFIDLVKITGTAEETRLDAMDLENRTVVVMAKFKNPIPEFVGTFGMPNLGKLNIILNIPEYKENASIAVTQKEGGELDGINFVNKAGDFRNDYRFMSAGIVNAKLQAIEFKGAKWTVSFVPSVTSIQKLKFQSQANAEETTFLVKTDKGNLKFFFGSASTHEGSFVFEQGVADMKRNFAYPVAQVIAILNLPGDKTMNLSDENGALMITVDSGIADYNYIIPANTK
jgi:hypothetical protein